MSVITIVVFALVLLLKGKIFKLDFILFFVIFLMFYLFLTERERQRESARECVHISGGGADREGDRTTGSPELTTAKPHRGLGLRKGKITT